MKNAMGMVAGYSPYQTVFGKNPILPGFEVHPPALNDIKGDMLLRHLKALSEAKKAFVEADTSEKIIHALRHKSRMNERENNTNREENGQDGINARAEVARPLSSEIAEEELWETVKVNDKLRFRSGKTDLWTMGTVVGRAGKTSGKYASWFNVETNDDRFSIDLR